MTVLCKQVFRAICEWFTLALSPLSGMPGCLIDTCLFVIDPFIHKIKTVSAGLSSSSSHHRPSENNTTDDFDAVDGKVEGAVEAADEEYACRRRDVCGFLYPDSDV